MSTSVLPQNITSTKVAGFVQRTPTALEIEQHNYDRLKERLLNKEAQIGVVGLGYVGLPLSMTFNAGGFSVLGFEKSAQKVEFLNEGVSYIQDVASKEVKKFTKTLKFAATLNFERLKECDVIVICVPTPLAKSQDPDMSFILSALDSIEKYLGEGQLIILESTTYPGTTREVMLPKLEAAGMKFGDKEFKCGRDFFLAFSPERVDPGNPTYNTYNTPKVVGGVTEQCGDLACIFYSQVLEKVVRVSSPESAEMVKLLENTFRAVNIGLVNEVAIMSEKLGIDCWEIIEAASSKPFGFMPFYPGPGLGGHCIPIDPSYLSWKLKTLDYTARFIELANNINSSMPQFCVDRITASLNRDKKAVNGSKILILGVAYKRDIDDLRESPAIDLIHLLKERGAKIDYYDPYVPEVKYEGLELKSIAWSENVGAAYDVVVIATDHSSIDYAALLKSSKRIIDTRNALKDFKDSKITKL